MQIQDSNRMGSVCTTLGPSERRVRAGFWQVLKVNIFLQANLGGSLCSWKLYMFFGERLDFLLFLWTILSHYVCWMLHEHKHQLHQS